MPKEEDGHRKHELSVNVACVLQVSGVGFEI